MKLISKFVAGPAGAFAGGVAALRHEIRDDAMEDDALVESFTRQEDKVVYGLGGFVGEEFNNHCAFFCFHAGFVFLFGVNDHRGRGVPLFCHLVSLFHLCGKSTAMLWPLQDFKNYFNRASMRATTMSNAAALNPPSGMITSA